LRLKFKAYRAFQTDSLGTLVNRLREESWGTY
jgi:hypothetical protein